MGILTKGEYTVTNLEDGRGISKSESTYQKSTSGTVIPTGTWTTSIPSVDAGQYLWTRTIFTYTDNTTSSMYSVGRMGTNGKNGLGISNNNVHYQASSSGTTAPTGTWTTTIPTVAANQYLWTRTTITYTDGSSTVSYSVGKMGADGKDAQLLYLTASSQIQAFDKDDKPKTTQAITISAKLQNASGTATFTAIPYIGNTAQTPITLGGTGNDRTLLPSQWASTEWTSIAITATLGPLTDTISVVKVKDGRTPVVHTAWADSEDGTVGFSLEKPVGKIPKYKGHYVDYSLEASTDPADYKWERNPDDAGNVADDANNKSDLANQLANAAKELADKAKADAAEANRLLGLLDGEMDRLNTDVSNARSELERAEAELNSQIETVETKLTQDYATKTSLSETQITLNKTISDSVASVKQEMSETYAVKTDLTNLSGDYASFKEETAKKFSQQVSSIETIQTDTEAAKKLVNDALSKAQSAITNATNANNLANSALTKASDATSVANSASRNATNAVASANSAVSTANTAKSNADKAIADVAALTKTVTTQSTRIDQTSSRIDQVASGVTEVGNRLDGMSIGDENLINLSEIRTYNDATADTSNYIKRGEVILTTSVKENSGIYFDFYNDSKPETYYVFSYDITALGSQPFNTIRGHMDTGFYTIKFYVDGVDTKISYPSTYTFNDSAVRKHHVEVYIKLKNDITDTRRIFIQPNHMTPASEKYKIENLKIVEGNKYTNGWSAAPGDIKSEIDNTNSNIASNYYQKTTVDSKLSTAVDGITAQYTKDITTRLGNYYDKSTIDSKLTIDGTGISTYVKSTQSQLNNTISTANNALTKANDAYSKANSAVTSATNASSTASSALSKASDATNVANSASQNANNAVASANSAVSTANTAKSNADKAIADVASLTQTVSSQSTRIDQTSSRIEQVASGVTEVGNRLDGLQVGGRNLYIQSATNTFANDIRGASTTTKVTEKYGFKSDYKAVSNNYSAVRLQQLQFNGNKHAVISFNAYVNTGTLNLKVDICDLGNKNFTITTTNSRYSMFVDNIYRYNTPDNYNGFSDFEFTLAQGQTLYVEYIMVEYATTPSNHSPAPEDQQSQIDGINNNLSNNYYQKTTVDSKLSTAVSGITAQYTQDITTRLGNYYDKATIDSKLTIDGQGIASYVKSTQSQLDNLQIGGRNLAQGTSNEYSSEYSSFSGTTNNCPYLAKVLTDGLSVGDTVTVRLLYKYTDVVATSGQTAKCWIQGSGSSTSWNSGTFAGSSVKTLAGSGEFEFLYSFKITAEHLKNTHWDTNIRHDYIQSGSVQWKMFKVEKGNQATDWSPAPEDMATAEQAQQAQNDANDANSKADATEQRVSVAESTIKQLSDSISMLVTDNNGSSMMTQTSNGWTFNIGAIADAINSATNNIDNLSGSLSQTNNVVNNLNNLANDLSKKTAYINMTTDETGAPCIELGKTGNAFKVRITNTSVDFIQGSSKIAYVSNQALFIERAIIKSELQVGESKGFIWKTRSNGNMGLRWFG